LDGNVRQREIHTNEPLLPECSSFKVKIAIEKLKRNKSPGTDQIPAGKQEVIHYILNPLLFPIFFVIHPSF
jgi:hypothetical protein